MRASVSGYLFAYLFAVLPWATGLDLVPILQAHRLGLSLVSITGETISLECKHS